MSPPGKLLGVLTPRGGGDPIAIYKPEFVVGRRKTCDICLDFENVSGKHCVFRLINGVWHLRDLASTNGTLLNGLRLSSEHHVLPDDEVAIATHYFKLEYEAAGHSTLIQNKRMLSEEKDIVENRRQKSLMELAGFEDEDRARRPSASSAAAHRHEPVRRPSADEEEFEDVVPVDFPDQQEKPHNTTDSEFLRLFDEDFKRDKK